MTYTHGHAESVLRSHRWRTAANSAAYLTPHLRPGLRVLDVGAGPGTLTADLARLVAPGTVTAVEISDEVAELTRAGVAGLDNVEVVVGDVTALDFPDGSFDVVHAHQVLQHVTAPVQALREMLRVTAPGGLVAVRDSDYGAFAWAPADPELDRWREWYDAAARANGGEPNAGRYLLGWARAAGATQIEASSSTWTFATPADREFWAGMWSERIVASRLAEQLRESGVASDADLQRIADAWRRWSASDDGWWCVVHGELLITR